MKALIHNLCIIILMILSLDLAAAADKKLTIAFLGDSLTAGYGLSQEVAYPALIEKKLLAAGIDATVINAGLSGDTTSGGRRRINWLLKRPVDLLVIALGANDGLRGVPVSEMRKNLTAIIDAARTRNPQMQIVLAGMRMPPNMGSDYADDFHRMFRDLAQEHDTALIPFLLEGVGGVADLNQSDGIHPTAEGQKLLADTVWLVLEPLLTRQAN